jgi:hypothetical protein
MENNRLVANPAWVASQKQELCACHVHLLVIQSVRLQRFWLVGHGSPILAISEPVVNSVAK